MTKKEIRTLVNSYNKDERFSKRQLKEIETGIKDGLTKEQIAVYADPKFDEHQMNALRYGYKEGLSIEQNKIVADQRFTCFQMWGIRDGIKKNLSKEQMCLLLNPQLELSQMHMIIRGFEDNLTLNQVGLYANPDIPDGNMCMIERALKAGLSDEQIEPMLNTELSSADLDFYYTNIIAGYTYEELQRYLNQGFGSLEFGVIEDGFRNNMTKEQIAVYAKSHFDYNQMKEIYNGLIKGLPVKQVSLYAKKDYDERQMRFIKNELLDGKLTEEQVKILVDNSYGNSYNLDQMKEIAKALHDGVSIVQIKQYARPHDSVKELMSDRYKALNKRKDFAYYKVVIQQFMDSIDTEFLSNILCGLFFITLVLSDTLLGDLYCINWFEHVVNFISKSVFSMFVIAIAGQAFSAILFTPPGTGIMRVLNIIISCFLFYVCGLIPGQLISIAFCWLVLYGNIKVLKYINSIRYES